jgi:hypothetical protein
MLGNSIIPLRINFKSLNTSSICQLFKVLKQAYHRGIHAMRNSHNLRERKGSHYKVAWPLFVKKQTISMGPIPTKKGKLLNRILFIEFIL